MHRWAGHVLSCPLWVTSAAPKEACFSNSQGHAAVSAFLPAWSRELSKGQPPPPSQDQKQSHLSLAFQCSLDEQGELNLERCGPE